MRFYETIQEIYENNCSTHGFERSDPRKIKLIYLMLQTKRVENLLTRLTPFLQV